MKIKSRRCRNCRESARLAKTKGKRPRWLCVNCHYTLVECRESKPKEEAEAESKPTKKSKARRYA